MSPNPVHVTADLAVLTFRDNTLCTVLTRRPDGYDLPGLPGGPIEADDAEHTAARALARQTSLTADAARLDFLGVYDQPDRHPERRTISAAYLAFIPADAIVESAWWRPVDDAAAEPLALDHGLILADAIDLGHRLLQHTTAAAELLDRFTIADLRGVYETLWQTRFDPGNFQRRLTRTTMAEALIPTGQHRRGTGRPAMIYRAGPRQRLTSPLLPPEAFAAAARR